MCSSVDVYGLSTIQGGKACFYYWQCQSTDKWYHTRPGDAQVVPCLMHVANQGSVFMCGACVCGSFTTSAAMPPLCSGGTKAASYACERTNGPRRKVLLGELRYASRICRAATSVTPTNFACGAPYRTAPRLVTAGLRAADRPPAPLVSRFWVSR